MSVFVFGIDYFTEIGQLVDCTLLSIPNVSIGIVLTHS